MKGLIWNIEKRASTAGAVVVQGHVRLKRVWWVDARSLATWLDGSHLSDRFSEYGCAESNYAGLFRPLDKVVIFATSRMSSNLALLESNYSTLDSDALNDEARCILLQAP